MTSHFFAGFRLKFIAVITAVLLPAAIYSASGWAQTGTVDINGADELTLAEVLTGVGDSLAAAIVKERESNGPFLSADDLERVRGIGSAIVDKNRSKIVVNAESNRLSKPDDQKSVSSAENQEKAVNQ